MKDKLTTFEIETAVANYFDIRQNIIVPNVSWGVNLHECDLLVIRKSGYGIEIEIKITKADLRKDKQKRHNHVDYFNRLRELYFAIPDYLNNCIEFIPERAGIILVSKNIIAGTLYTQCNRIRKPKININASRFADNEILKIAHLGTMRLWSARSKYINLKKTITGVQNQLNL